MGRMVGLLALLALASCASEEAYRQASRACVARGLTGDALDACRRRPPPASWDATQRDVGRALLEGAIGLALGGR